MRKQVDIVIGACLREVRLRQGLTQTQVASACEEPQSFVSKLELGDRGFRFAELFVYAQALGVEPKELFAEINRSLARHLRKQSDKQK